MSDKVVLADGSVLQVESLEATLKAVTFNTKHLRRMWPMIDLHEGYERIPADHELFKNLRYSSGTDLR